MASALRLDTLAFTKRLREAGADERLAEAIVEGLTAADTSELATKADVAAVKADVAAVEVALKADVAAVKAELAAEIAEVKADVVAVKADVAAVKADVAAVKAELTAEIATATNRAIYTLGGLIGVLFVIDRLLPLFAIGG